MAAPLLLFPIGQQWIDSSLAGMLNGAVPIFAAVTAAILLRRLPASRLLVGIAVGFVGVVGVLWPATRDADATALGASLVLLAVLCYGVAVNIAVPLQQRYGALPVLLRAQMVALVLLAPAALVSLPSSGFAWSSTLAVVALGFFGTGWAFVAMTTLVGRVGATRGSVAIYFLPVVAIVLGVVFEDETIAAISLVGDRSRARGRLPHEPPRVTPRPPTAVVRADRMSPPRSEGAHGMNPLSTPRRSGLRRPTREDFNTSNSQPGEDGSKPCSISQRAASRLRNDHHARITSRSTSVP
jgi:hypothetical protein